MSAGGAAGAATGGESEPGVGLCDRCRHQQVVRTTRGSVFSLCRRSRDEPERYPRYPRVPVLRCPGFERGTPEAEPDPGLTERAADPGE